ncbi:ABC transporter permease, partial [Cribrihabitans sp. XS_ASV171]
MTQLPDGRYVDDAPYDPQVSIQQLERRDLDAPNWVLVWRKFKTHKLGLVSGLFLLVCYLMLPFAGFIAPYGPNERNGDHLYAPPQSVHWFHEGEFLGPFVYPTVAEADLETFQWTFVADESDPRPLEFFCEGESYKLAGLIESDTHL